MFALRIKYVNLRGLRCTGCRGPHVHIEYAHIHMNTHKIRMHGLGKGKGNHGLGTSQTTIKSKKGALMGTGGHLGIRVHSLGDGASHSEDGLVGIGVRSDPQRLETRSPWDDPVPCDLVPLLVPGEGKVSCQAPDEGPSRSSVGDHSDLPVLVPGTPGGTHKDDHGLLLRTLPQQLRYLKNLRAERPYSLQGHTVIKAIQS